MAATHTPTCNPVKITVSGTSDNSIDMSQIMRSGEMIIRVHKGDYIYVKGSAGSETFNISLL